MSYRKGRKLRVDRSKDVVWLAKQLPLEFRSYDGWVWVAAAGGVTDGLRAHWQGVRDFITDLTGVFPEAHLVTAVQHRAAGDWEVWYLQAFELDSKRRFYVVK